MVYDAHACEYVLTSGRRFSCVTSVIGLGAETLADVYAFQVHVGGDRVWLDQAWTPAERAELADAMIARWQAFRATT